MICQNSAQTRQSNMATRHAPMQRRARPIPLGDTDPFTPTRARPVRVRARALSAGCMPPAACRTPRNLSMMIRFFRMGRALPAVLPLFVFWLPGTAAGLTFDEALRLAGQHAVDHPLDGAGGILAGRRNLCLRFLHQRVQFAHVVPALAKNGIRLLQQRH